MMSISKKIYVMALAIASGFFLADSLCAMDYVRSAGHQGAAWLLPAAPVSRAATGLSAAVSTLRREIGENSPLAPAIRMVAEHAQGLDLAIVQLVHAEKRNVWLLAGASAALAVGGGIATWKYVSACRAHQRAQMQAQERIENLEVWKRELQNQHRDCDRDSAQLRVRVRELLEQRDAGILQQAALNRELENLIEEFDLLRVCSAARSENEFAHCAIKNEAVQTEVLVGSERIQAMTTPNMVGQWLTKFQQHQSERERSAVQAPRAMPVHIAVPTQPAQTTDFQRHQQRSYNQHTIFFAGENQQASSVTAAIGGVVKTVGSYLGALLRRPPVG